MPVYEYECDVCGMRFDLQRHFGDPHPMTCPAGHEGVHRVFAPPAIIFKGSGFYATDHRRNGRASQRTSKDKEASSADKETSSEKTDSKTDTKTGEQV